MGNAQTLNDLVAERKSLKGLWVLQRQDPDGDGYFRAPDGLDVSSPADAKVTPDPEVEIPEGYRSMQLEQVATIRLDVDDGKVRCRVIRFSEGDPKTWKAALTSLEKNWLDEVKGYEKGIANSAKQLKENLKSAELDYKAGVKDAKEEHAGDVAEFRLEMKNANEILAVIAKTRKAEEKAADGGKTAPKAKSRAKSKPLAKAALRRKARK